MVTRHYSLNTHTHTYTHTHTHTNIWLACGVCVCVCVCVLRSSVPVCSLQALSLVGTISARFDQITHNTTVTANWHNLLCVCVCVCPRSPYGETWTDSISLLTWGKNYTHTKKHLLKEELTVCVEADFNSVFPQKNFKVAGVDKSLEEDLYSVSVCMLNQRHCILWFNIRKKNTKIILFSTGRS